MMNRKSVLIAVLCLLFPLLLSACKTEDKYTGYVLPFPMDIVVESQTDSKTRYWEVDKETIQRLNLGVESCDGLTEVGKIVDAGRETSRPVYEKNRKIYEQEGLEPKEMTVVVPETAYAHPDPHYPNLVVALVDGEPAIFQFSSFSGFGYHPESGDRIAPSDLVAIYGLTSPDAIREIRVSSQEEDQDVVPKATITEQAEIKRFLDAIQSWDDWGWPAGARDPDTAYPRYYVEGDLANGFTFSFDLTPKTNNIEWASFRFLGNEALNAWIESHV